MLCIGEPLQDLGIPPLAELFVQRSREEVLDADQRHRVGQFLESLERRDALSVTLQQRQGCLQVWLQRSRGRDTHQPVLRRTNKQSHQQHVDLQHHQSICASVASSSVKDTQPNFTKFIRNKYFESTKSGVAINLLLEGGWGHIGRPPLEIDVSGPKHCFRLPVL